MERRPFQFEKFWIQSEGDLMTDFKVNGLVIKEAEYGDNDKLLTILTEKYGKLFVIGNGCKKPEKPPYGVYSAIFLCIL